MSIEATTRVWKFSRARGTARVVLLAIADIADVNGYAWPSVPNVARKSIIDVSTAKRILNRLRQLGELQIWDRTTENGEHASSLYRVISSIGDATTDGTVPKDVLQRMGSRYKLRLRAGAQARPHGRVATPPESLLDQPPNDDIVSPCSSVQSSESSKAVHLGEDGFVVAATLLTQWRQAYPALDVSAELRRAFAWVQANPKHRKSNWQRFLVNWLARAQDRARPDPRTPPHQTLEERKAQIMSNIKDLKPSTFGES